MGFAISAGHELTRDTAREILENGGNAFDAAIAAYAVMFISEPAMASAGASGLATTYSKEHGIKVFDFFSQTPHQQLAQDKIDYYPICIEFPDTTEEFHVGLAASTVPGAIAGIFKIHEAFGSIPIQELFQPAIHHCKSGVALDDFQAYDLKLLQEILRADKIGTDIFFTEDRIKKSGEMIQMPQAADFLEYIGKAGSDAFYKGEIAKSICDDCISKGAHLRREDFENYDVGIHDPLIVNNGDISIASPGSPSIGSFGLALYWGLCVKKKWSDEQALKYTAENIRNKEKVLNELNALFPDSDIRTDQGPLATNGTSHFTIVDKHSNAISLTSSLGEGCGYFIPNTQMHMNNMLGEPYLLPGGTHSWKKNVRLNSMMTPSIILENQQLKMVTGSGGASRIPVVLKQVISNVLEKNMSLEEATELPRIHFQENTLHLEDSRECQYPDGDYKIERWSAKSLYFGGVNSVLIHPDGHLEAWADRRRLGSAGVWD